MSEIRQLVEAYNAFYTPGANSRTGRTLPLMSGINVILSDHESSRADLKAKLVADALGWAEDGAAALPHAEHFAELLLVWFGRYCEGRRDLLRRQRWTLVNAAAIVQLKRTLERDVA